MDGSQRNDSNEYDVGCVRVSLYILSAYEKFPFSIYE